MPRRGWGIQVIGSEGAAKALETARKALGASEIQEAFLPAAIEVRNEAKFLAPIGDGKRPDGSPRPHLRELIFATKGKEGTPSVIVGVDLKKAPHAHLVEFGHGGPRPAAPHPYMRPAVDRKRSRIKRLAADAILGLLRKAGIRL